MMMNRSIQALLALLVLGIFSLAYLAQKPLCIDSNLVEKIDRLDANGLTSAYSCQYKKRVSIDEKIFQMAPILAERLYPLEKFFTEFGFAKKAVQIEWQSDQLGLVKTLPDRIIISTDFLTKPYLLEKLIARHWVQGHLPANLKEDSLMVHALADLIVYATYDSWESDKWKSDKDDTGSAQPLARWPHVLKTFSSYCQGYARSEEHKDVCEQAAIDNPVLLDQLTPYSLQPLLSQSLISAYLNQNISKRYAWLKSLAQGEWQWRQHEAVNYLGLSEWDQVSSEVENFEQKLPQTVADPVETELNRRGFFSAKNKASFDLVFLLPEEENLQKDLMPKLIDLSQKNSKLMIAAEDSMRVWLMPGKDFLTRSLMQSYHSQRAVWLKCEAPSLEDFKNMSKRFERILLLSDCQKNINANLRSYVQGGIEAFATDNQTLSFIQLHIPSLMQALKKSEVNPIPLLGLQQFTHPLFKAMGWQGATWIEGLRAYRSKSAIDAIEMYRL